MPSKSRKTNPSRHHANFFIPLVVLVFLLWMIYRTLFAFDVWFDELIGKALFFGFPVWLYITSTQAREIIATYEVSKFKVGLLRGVAFGGIFGFVGSLLALLGQTEQVMAAYLFTSDVFWWEFFLAMVTAFWETLFFFGFVMTVIQQHWAKWSLTAQVALTAGIFLLFHIPNTFLRFTGADVGLQLGLLTLFAVGQALLFSREKNAYTLILTHTFWGMVLFIHW